MTQTRPAWVTPEQFAALDGLEGWRYIMGAIQTELHCRSFAEAAALVNGIAAAADELDHHPDMHVRYPGIIEVTLTTHAEQAVTTLDVDLARRISAMAAAAAVRVDPSFGQVNEIAIDTVDADAIRPFWAAVMAYHDMNGMLVDPARRGPNIWFQQMDEAREGRGRFHIDVSVAYDVAEQRVADAVAAGGRLVTDDFAKAWWVLADAEGNEVCICTWQDRS